jgi:hypothetical protein
MIDVPEYFDLIAITTDEAKSSRVKPLRHAASEFGGGHAAIPRAKTSSSLISLKLTSRRSARGGSKVMLMGGKLRRVLHTEPIPTTVGGPHIPSWTFGATIVRISVIGHHGGGTFFSASRSRE